MHSYASQQQEREDWQDFLRTVLVEFMDKHSLKSKQHIEREVNEYLASVTIPIFSNK